MKYLISRGSFAAAAALTILGDVTSSSSLAQQTLAPLNVGVIKIAGLTDVYAGQKLGYFAEQGLEVNVTLANNGQDLLAAQQSGKLDVVLAIPGTAMQARDKGYKVVLVMQNEVAHHNAPDQGALLVKYDGPITSLKQLEGKKIAFGQLSNQQWAGVRVVLQNAGVKMDTVQEIEVPFPQMPGVLQQGLVEAVAALEPFVSAMIASKQARVLSWNYVESVPGQPNGAFWATEEWSAKNRTTIRKFQIAMHKSIVYLTSHPVEAKTLIAEFTGMRAELIANLIPDVWTDRVVRADWEKTMQLMVGAGLIKKTMTFAELVPAYAMNPGQ